MPRTPNKITLLPPASSLLFLATTSLVLAVHPETKWDEGIDPACCAYPEHDPRDYNWPYSHFLYSEVIPDVVGSYVSMTSLNLTYAPAADGKDQSPAVVEYGRLIAPSRVATPPSVAFDLETDRDASTLHTLMMVDPDVPFRDAPTDGQWLHWLVYDIPGNDTARGRTLVEYTPPAPRACPADDDLCLRLFQAQLPMVIVPQVQALHRSRGSVKGNATYRAEYLRGYHHAQSKLLFSAKHISPRVAQKLRGQLVWQTLLALPFRVLVFSPKLIARMWGRLRGAMRWTLLRGLA